MVSDVPVDDEAPVVTSGIFRSAGAQSFGGAHRGRVCVRVFIECECACVLWASSLYCVILKKQSSNLRIKILTEITTEPIPLFRKLNKMHDPVPLES